MPKLVHIKTLLDAITDWKAPYEVAEALHISTKDAERMLKSAVRLERAQYGEPNNTYRVSAAIATPPVKKEGQMREPIPDDDISEAADSVIEKAYSMVDIRDYIVAALMAERSRCLQILAAEQEWGSDDLTEAMGKIRTGGQGTQAPPVRCK